MLTELREKRKSAGDEENYDSIATRRSAAKEEDYDTITTPHNSGYLEPQM